MGKFYYFIILVKNSVNMIQYVYNYIKVECICIAKNYKSQKIYDNTIKIFVSQQRRLF